MFFFLETQFTQGMWSVDYCLLGGEVKIVFKHFRAAILIFQRPSPWTHSSQVCVSLSLTRSCVPVTHKLWSFHSEGPFWAQLFCLCMGVGWWLKAIKHGGFKNKQFSGRTKWLQESRFFSLAEWYTTACPRSVIYFYKQHNPDTLVHFCVHKRHFISALTVNQRFVLWSA